MFMYKLKSKRSFLWVFFTLQVLLLIWYCYVCKDDTSDDYQRISFVDLPQFEPRTRNNRTYHLEGDKVTVPRRILTNEFVNFNSSLCFINGTDLNAMGVSSDSWRCMCKKGWHGAECGQPEIIWRALLTFKKKVVLKGPRTYARRIFYIFKVDEFLENMIDIRINELNGVVDLYILLDEGDQIEKLLRKRFLKKYLNKIFYLKNVNLGNVWTILSASVGDIDDEDIFLISKSYEIPNKLALNFLKYYNNFPEAILFRLRWSVFGFFWQHPKRTILEGFACTVKYFGTVFDYNFENVFNIKTSSVSHLILGDLNHYGGWYCEFCMEPQQVINMANQRRNIKLMKWKILGRETIDSSYIEELIGNGFYIDGKTELERARRYHDKYFAPDYVLGNSNELDYLLINLYTKLDYYEN